MKQILMAATTTALLLSLLIPSVSAQTMWTDPKTGLQYEIPMGYYCLDFDGDYICDVDFKDGKMVLYGESESDQVNSSDGTEDEAGGNVEDEAGGKEDGNGREPGPIEEWNDSCRNSGYQDGQNGPFSAGTHDHCGEEEGGSNSYYHGFIDGCMDADNSKDVCEMAAEG